MKSFDSILKKIDFEISSALLIGEPESLYLPIEYILSLGGKRIRPALAIVGCNIFSDDIEAVIKPALGIEVFHNFTLLHDDLMDNAEKRRNRQTVHVKWNPNVAILSGDAMMIASYKLIGETPSRFLSPILSLFSETALGICEGQQYDMEFEQRLDVTEEEYIKMIKMKTAILLACSLKTGAIIGGASEQAADFLYNYGIDLGLAFQLQDDFLDVYGDPATFGKNIGGDILSNKKTFLLIKALQVVDEEKKKEVLNWLNEKDYVPEQKIAYFTKLYTEYGIKELTEKRILSFYEKAKESLSKLDVAEERLTVLKEISETLMSRNV